MKITLPTLITLFILSACAQVASPHPSSATVESLTLTKRVEVSTPKPSSTPWPTPTLYPTPTKWVKVYPTKKPLLIYSTSSRNEYTLHFIEWGDFYPMPYLILYEDGQLMFGIGGSVKQLTHMETDEILVKLEQLGFFQIQHNNAADMLTGMQNPLYTFPIDEKPAPNNNLPWIEVTVNGQESKSISYRQEWEQYLIQPMKDIISYLDSISSDGATPYQPDRLLVGFDSEEGRPIPEDAIIIPWPEDMTSPAHRSYMGVLYLEGEEALRLYKAAGENLFEYFSFDGKNYNVYLRPILPHECHIYHFHELKNFPEQAQPYFTCDGW